MGRNPGPSWVHFSTVETYPSSNPNHTRMQCKFCETIISRSHPKAKKHLDSCGSFHSAGGFKPPAVKKSPVKTTKKSSAKAAKSVVKAKTTVASPKKSPLAIIKPQDGSSPKRAKTAAAAAAAATATTAATSTSDSMTPELTVSLHQEMAMCIYASGGSFATFEQPLFVEFFRRLRPAFRLPSRSKMNRLLLELSNA
jgi:hypothetical protein